jgi:hypothetical protein
MSINYINYILKKKEISQNELAVMLDPPVSKSMLSKWKNGGEEIPRKRLIELRRIARIGKYKDGQNEEWLKITNNSKDIQDSWYINMFEFIKKNNRNTESLYLAEEFGSINYDSIWIENIQTMLITLSKVGVPVKDLDFTFEPTREIIFEDDGDQMVPVRSAYTSADNLLIPYIKVFSKLRLWVMWIITSINDKKISELQIDFINKIPEIALSHIDKELFKAVGTDMDFLDKFIKKSKTETLKLILQFSQNVPSNNIEYLNFLNGDLKVLSSDIRSHPKYIEEKGGTIEHSRVTDGEPIKYDIFEESVQQQIIDGIENNEKLLKEILKKLNKLTDKEE